MKNVGLLLISLWSVDIKKLKVRYILIILNSELRRGITNSGYLEVICPAERDNNGPSSWKGRRQFKNISLKTLIQRVCSPKKKSILMLQ